MNWIALSAESPGVKRDANGVPFEWTLLKVGDNPICRDGQDGVIRLTPEDMKQIMEYYHKKNESIPVDSEHYLYELANQKKLDEGETLKLFPGGVAAMGYGRLFLNGDDLRCNVAWNPAAYEMMKEKIYKYFSPVIRGMENGPLRVTSVAMTNTPAINNLDALAARAETHKPATGRKEKMSKLNKALSRLLGRESLALEAEIKEDEKDKIACEVEEKADLIEQVKKLLGLREDATLEEVIAALKGMDEKAKSADEKQTQLDQLNADVEKAAHDKQIERGRAEKKIVDSDMDYVNSLDSKALSAYLDHAAPKFAAPLPFKAPARQEPNPDELTPEEKEACRLAHITEEQFLKSKKERMK